MIHSNARNDVGRRVFAKMAALAAACTLGGCVQLSAPDKPIEINLNINIRQEVLVSLRKDVQDLVDKNPGVF